MFHELGKVSKEKEIKIEIERLKEFSEKIVEDEFVLNKFNLDDY
jgi:hypothetical protein